MERDLALEALEADDYEDVDSDDEEGSSPKAKHRIQKATASYGQGLSSVGSFLLPPLPCPSLAS